MIPDLRASLAEALRRGLDADGRCSRCLYYEQADFPKGVALLLTRPLVKDRCVDHGAMMREIHDVWYSADDRVCDLIWSLSDGYGEAGFVPEQGYDWSGIRDSSTAAVEEMYRAIHA